MVKLNEIKIKFLGTAQDGGIPHMGCNCENCRVISRLVSSIGISDGNNSIIIDATPDIEKQMRLFGGLNSINGIFLTHLHIGHYSGLIHLGKEVANTSNFPVYMSEKHLKFIEKNKPFSYLIERQQIDPIIIEMEEKIKFDHFSITGFEVPHRNEDGNTLGFEIRTDNQAVIFIPDIDYLDEDTKIRMENVDIIIFDGTFYSYEEIGNQINVPHPPITDTIEEFGLLKREEKNTPKFYFTHFNHTNPVLSDKKIMKRILNQGYDLAKDGMKIDLY